MSSLPNSTASTTRIGAHRNNATATPRRAEAHELAALAVEAAMLSEQIAEARR